MQSHVLNVRKNIKGKVTSICVHSKLRNLLQNNLANFNQTWRHNKSLSEWMQIIKTESLSSRAGIIRALL